MRDAGEHRQFPYFCKRMQRIWDQLMCLVRCLPNAMYLTCFRNYVSVTCVHACTSSFPFAVAEKGRRSAGEAPEKRRKSARMAPEKRRRKAGEAPEKRRRGNGAPDGKMRHEQFLNHNNKIRKGKTKQTRPRDPTSLKNEQRYQFSLSTTTNKIFLEIHTPHYQQIIQQYTCTNK